MKPMINQGKHSGEYDAKRLAQSLKEACYSVGTSEGATKDFVKRVISSTETWLTDRPEVTDDDVRRKAAELLEKLCPEAGYLYKNQKSIL